MQKEYRIRNPKYCFDTRQTEPYRLSRSKIDLFLECPRCFYLDQRFGVGRPSFPPFSLNNAVDELLKKEFDYYRGRQEVHPTVKKDGVHAVPFQHEELEAWRDSLRRGVQTLHEPTNLIIRGGIDDVWINENKELHVVDYKATSKKTEINLDAAWQDSYKRQAEVYQWLLRQNGFSVSNIAYFVYVNGITDHDHFNNTLEFQWHLIPYEGSDDWVDQTVRDMHACLVSPAAPDRAEYCEFCGYREAAGKTLLDLQNKNRRSNGA